MYLFLINALVNYEISHPRILYIQKNFNSDFSYIEVWFTDQSSKTLKIEDEINITLVINQIVKYE